MPVSEIASVMPQYASIKSSMYRAKHQKYPMPSVIDGETVPGERFLLFDGLSEIRDTRRGRDHVVVARERVTIYSSDYGLRLLNQAVKIGADGTFKACPAIFAQLYIIMAWMHNDEAQTTVCLPAAYVLLGGKHSKFDKVKNI